MSEVKGACEQEEKLFFIFKKAIEGEQEAQRIYKDAIECCSDQMMSKVLHRLHDEEVQHETTLKEYYGQLREKYDTNGRPR